MAFLTISILLFGLLGLALFGPLGLLLGGGVGFWLAQRARRRLLVARAQIEQGYLQSVFSVMGCLCQADGRVSAGERDIAERLFTQMRFSDSQRAEARAAFERGRAESFDLDAELARVGQLTQRQPMLRQVFLQVQLNAIAADGEIHDAERDMLMRVARGIGCSDTELAQIEAMLDRAASNGQATSEASLKDAYRVLGVSDEASDAEVKKAYRRLMSQNHPDKLAGKGLPESMREVAQQRTSEISNAFDRIKSAREAS
ncbi:co-chaperone DjlA [Halomonas sp. HNIBRBA4712]|uniref:co-chaperone DjlA n=1 Tax=Halomonas sp. HNIBRBA4712 TaxID=3373087 RepID=UPI003746836E